MFASQLNAPLQGFDRTSPDVTLTGNLSKSSKQKQKQQTALSARSCRPGWGPFLFKTIPKKEERLPWKEAE